jgi:hypothetical protein
MKVSDALMALSQMPRDKMAERLKLDNVNVDVFPTDTLIQRISGIKTPDEMPLLFATPVFLIEGKDETCPFWKLLPEESKPDGPTNNVVFLGAFLDKLRILHGWSFLQLAGLVRNIERELSI